LIVSSTKDVVMPDARIYMPIPQQRLDELLDDAAKARLDGLGEVVSAPTATADDVAAAARNMDILLIHSASPPLSVEACLAGRLRLIAYTAGSVKKMIPKAIVDGGVAVSQCAAAMAPAVAEMSLTLALVLLRKVHQHERVLSATHDWPAARQAGMGDTLRSRRIGVIGASRTGVEYIRLVRGISEHPVTVFDPYLTDDRAAELGVVTAELDDVFASCDLIAVHAPTTPETHHMIGVAQLARLPDQAIIVNTARSWVIDEAALLVEVRSGRLRAGLDVFDTEPLPPDSPFYGLDNVVVSPHRAGATYQTRRLQGQIAIDEIERFLRGEPRQHAVTSENYDHLA
jgi:phosphoglycerate dehydrogenase-like enzyme